MNFLLGKQADRVLFGKNSNFDDFEDWMWCANQNEERWNEQFKVAKRKDVSNIFQFDVESNFHNVNDIARIFAKVWR